MRHRARPFDIVHVSSAHPWTDNRIHGRAAASAASGGYRTALIAVTTDDPDPEPDWEGPDRDSGVYVRRIPRRSRAGRMCVSTVQVIAAAMSSRARVVHLHDPELLWAVLLLRLMGRAVVYDAHEDLPDQVRGKEYLAPLARRVGVVVAHVAVRLAGRAHVVIGATPAITRRFPADRTIVVRNVPRIMDDHVPPAPNECAPVAVYVGSLSHDRGLEVLTGVAGSPDLPSGWRIVTAGPIDAAVDRRRFDALVASGHIDHRGVVPPRAARELMSGSRVGLLPLLPTPAYRMSIPTKLFEYMASGTAVVATDVPLWRELLAGSECATWVPPGDPGAVVAALQRYEDDPELLERHAASGRALVRERFRWDREEQELLAVYRKLFGTTPLPEVGTH